jgi:hypothetical protein
MDTGYRRTANGVEHLESGSFVKPTFRKIAFIQGDFLAEVQTDHLTGPNPSTLIYASTLRSVAGPNLGPMLEEEKKRILDIIIGAFEFMQSSYEVEWSLAFPS